MDRKKKKGFTLVELIVVLAILAILAAMLVPALTGYIDKANEKKVIATSRQYYVAAQTVASEAYANGDEINSIVIVKNSEKESLNGNYIAVNEENDDLNNKYLKEFIDLAEINEDTKYIYIYPTKDKITDMTVCIGNYTATLASGEWTVSTFSNS